MARARTDELDVRLLEPLVDEGDRLLGGKLAAEHASARREMLTA